MLCVQISVCASRFVHCDVRRSIIEMDCRFEALRFVRWRSLIPSMDYRFEALRHALHADKCLRVEVCAMDYRFGGNVTLNPCR
jgi:hypothetical protein